MQDKFHPREGSGAGPGAIAVVMVAHDSAQDLQEALTSLAAASSVVQVVVVNNASTDDSAEIVRRHRQENSGGPSVLLLDLKVNSGFAGGCNRGLAAVDPAVRYVASMNPDVRPDRECLARCVAVLDADPSVGAVAPLLVRPDGETVDSAGQVLKRWTLEVRDLGYGRVIDEVGPANRTVLAGCGALTVYRREALESAAGVGGPWAEHYFCFWEDLELGWRLTTAGWRVVFEPGAQAIHGRGAGAEEGRGPLRWRRPVHLEACILTNRWMTLIRHLHHTDALLRWPVLMVWDLIALGLGTIRRPQLLVHVWRRLPLIRREMRRRSGRLRWRLADLPWQFD